MLSSMVASNPRWLAPEILAGLPYTVAADVYSFGVIMWELLTWEVPWHQQNTWQVRGQVAMALARKSVCKRWSVKLNVADEYNNGGACSWPKTVCAVV